MRLNHVPVVRAARELGRYINVRLRLDYRLPGELKAPARVIRQHTQRQVKLLQRSLRDFGAVFPVVVDRDDVIVAGAAMVEAARRIEWPELPVIQVTHLDDHQLRLLRIAHTKLAEGGSWDMDALRLEFEEIALERPELDLSSSGFQMAERDIIYGRHRVSELADLDDDVPPRPGPPTSRPGDVYRLGRHRLACGSALDAVVLAEVIDGRMVRMVASDLPYNVKIARNVSGLGKTTHREFGQASGEMSRAQFIAFLEQAIGTARPHLIDGALLYLFMDWRHISELNAAAAAQALTSLNLLVWAKTNAGMGSFYRSAYELIGVFKHGDAPHTNNVELGRHGRNRTNVIHMPGVNTFGKGRSKALELHPTVKPVGLMADLMLDASGLGELVLDPFGGSGTTLIAAEKTDRTAALVELDPIYVDVICRRYAAVTGEEAVHVATGSTFDELARTRAEETR